MFNRLTSAQIPSHLVVLYLFLLVVAVRAPFWFPAVIGWDESTFIIIGQSILDGHLLYDRYWDLKPPLVFVAIAAFLYGLGDSIVAVRIGGALLVFSSSLLVLHVARRVMAPNSAALSAAVYVIASSVLYSGQNTTSEHIAVLPLMAGVALLVVRSPAGMGLRLVWRSGLIGFLIAAACLARPNLVYLAVAIAVLLMFHPDHRTRLSRPLVLVAYGLSGLATVGATLVPYAWSGEFEIWWRSMVVAPLASSGGGNTWSEAAFELAKSSVNVTWSSHPFAVLVVCFAIGSLVCALRRLCHAKRAERWSLLVLVVVFAATLFSAVVSGGAHSHYLLQIVPFLAIFVGLWVAVPPRSDRTARLSALALFGAALLAFRPTVIEAVGLFERLEAQRPVVYGPSVEAAAFIRSLALKDYSIYAMSDHIVYWMLHKPPPTRVSTHPSNVFKPYILTAVYGPDATPAFELDRIFAEPPTIVIKRRDVWYMNDFKPELAQLAAYLEDYHLAFETGTTQVFVRTE